MNIKQLKIGFIGFGNMGQAIAEGWVLSNTIQPTQLYASARNQIKLAKKTSKLGIHAVETNEELIELVDIIVLAVKPYQIRDIIEPLKNELENKILISVAVNLLYEEFNEFLLEETEHLSTLPNTAVAVGEGVFLFEDNHSLSNSNYQMIQELFGLISAVEQIPTDQMAIAGIITGSAPAFVDLFIEALGDAGVKHGLSRATAYKLISQMMSGTANLQLKTGKHPAVLKDEITSPGGTTIKGLAALEKSGFRGSIIEAVDTILKNE